MSPRNFLTTLFEKAVAAADPMHQAGARTYRIRPWLLNEGSFNVRLTYSDGKREIT